MPPRADAGRLGRLRVGELQLSENLRLADYHRVEARADPKHVTGGFAPGETVTRVIEHSPLYGSIRGQERERFFGGSGRIRGRPDYFDSIAGRDQRTLRDRRRRRG